MFRTRSERLYHVTVLPAKAVSGAVAIPGFWPLATLMDSGSSPERQSAPKAAPTARTVAQPAPVTGAGKRRGGEERKDASKAWDSPPGGRPVAFGKYQVS